MKNLIPLLILTVFAIPSRGQSFKITPNDTLIATAPTGAFTVHDIWQVNTGPTDIIFHWKPVGVSIPSGWDYSMCDKGTCYPGVPGGTMQLVSPGDSGFLGFNVFPASKGGMAIVRIYVYADSFVNDGDTVTWIINSDVNSGLSKSNLQGLSFYPNPVVDMLHFTKALKSIQVVDMQGRVVLSANKELRLNAIDLSILPSGIYMFKGWDELNQPITERIFKN